MRFTHRNFGGRVWAVIIGAALAAATLAGTALADEQSTDKIGPHTHQLHGTVDATPAAGATTFKLDTERYGQVTVSLTASAPRGRGRGHGSARSHEISSLSDLKAGERVVVQGHTSTDGSTFIARRVHVLPEKGPADHATHLVGTISSASTTNGTTTIAVKLADGTTQSVTVSSSTKIRPEGKTVADLVAGTKVTVVEKNGAATGVVVMPA
jgi:hypothetical protein